LGTPSFRRRFGALEERTFRLLWAGQLVSGIGDALVPVAVAFAVLDLTGSAADLGLVLASMMASRVLFILAGGVWSDRLPRQVVMIAADLVRALVQALVAAAFFLDSVAVWQLVLAAGLFGASSAFFGPASTGLVKTIVPAERLQEANALIGISQNAVSIFGPALAGLLVAAFGYGLVFAIDAASFVVSAAFLVAMRLPRARPTEERQSFAADAKRGVREVLARRWLWTAFITFSISNLAIAAYFVLGPLVVDEELGGAKAWGLILTGGAVGGLAGSAVALRWKPRRPLVPAFLIMLSIPLQLLALVPPLAVPVLMLAGALAVASIAIGNALWDTMLQQHVPREAISRVSSLDWMISLVFMPLGYTLAGPLAETIGVDGALVLAAALGVAANLAILFVPDVRNLTRLEHVPDAAGEDAARPPQPVAV
jgi:MFS family permease